MVNSLTPCTTRRPVTLICSATGSASCRSTTTWTTECSHSPRRSRLCCRSSVRPAVDEDSLHDYLAHRSVPAPHTLFAGVRKVPQGHHLVVRPDGTVRSTAYWQLSPHSDVRRVTPREAVRLVDEALTDSVRDGPGRRRAGRCLSIRRRRQQFDHRAGGKQRQGAGLHTFSAGFGDARLDETSWARKVAGIVGSTHHEVIGHRRRLPADVGQAELASRRTALRARRCRGLPPRRAGSPARQGRPLR